MYFCVVVRDVEIMLDINFSVGWQCIIVINKIILYLHIAYYQQYEWKVKPYPCLANSWRSKPFPVPMSSTFQLDKSLSSSSPASALTSSTWFGKRPWEMSMHNVFVQDATTSITLSPNLQWWNITAQNQTVEPFSMKVLRMYHFQQFPTMLRFITIHNKCSFVISNTRNLFLPHHFEFTSIFHHTWIDARKNRSSL